MRSIDLNCDMGESYGRYILGRDEELMPYLTSVSLACGFHAGDPVVIQRTVENAVKHNLAIGAHPGYPDLQGFGRRKMEMTPEEVEAMVLYQIGALWGFIRSIGVEMTHVKPHGALYNQAAEDYQLAKAIISAVRRFSRNLTIVGMAGSILVTIGLDMGMKIAQEGFVERGYLANGRLMPREYPGSIIHDPVKAAEQAVRLAKEGINIQQENLPENIQIDTLCIHGDSPNALDVAIAVRSALEEAGIIIKNFAA
ncbi:MAG: LamB/YcsF family protein [Bellilinea sp.]|nr:MAG: LamB/YcsF family protein [Bellilinea sp.]